MNDYETPEGGAPENEDMPKSVDPIQNNTSRSETAGAETGKDPDAPGAGQTAGVYVQQAAPPRNTWQQPYTGGQPVYQQTGANPPAYHSPQYQSPQYSNPPQYGNYSHPSSGKATASLVLGIISLVFFWMSFFAIVSVICSIIGIVLGNSARKELSPEQGKGRATAGLVCSIIGLVLSVIMLVVFTLIVVAAFSYVPRFGGFNM